MESNISCRKSEATLMAIEYLVDTGVESSDITIALGPFVDYG